MAHTQSCQPGHEGENEAANDARALRGDVEPGIGAGQDGRKRSPIGWLGHGAPHVAVSDIIGGVKSDDGLKVVVGCLSDGRSDHAAARLAWGRIASGSPKPGKASKRPFQAMIAG